VGNLHVTHEMEFTSRHASSAEIDFVNGSDGHALNRDEGDVMFGG